jgi:hypothetical protein
MVRITLLPILLAMYLPFCGTQVVGPVLHPNGMQPGTLWVPPSDLAGRDLFYGPWGPERAPDPQSIYTLVELKHTGVNPGMTVRDAQGREWSVKQAPLGERPDEAPVEVVLSRVLSAVGYHQPPVYYLKTFTLRDDWGTRVERGGRFRLKDKSLKDRGVWSFQQNPFVGDDSYQGLLTILMLFNASDLKNSNNTLYEHRGAGGSEYWYVVRDLGTALGSTGRLVPIKNDPDAFARSTFITGVRAGFVQFGFRGFHQELIRDRITPAQVKWACALLGSLSDHQWHEAFLAGGYEPAAAARFIQALKQRIAAGQAL